MAKAPPPERPALFESRRTLALDMFRGYTVAAMLLVNFLGRFREFPSWLGHLEKGFAFADTVFPQFFFCAGYALAIGFAKSPDYAKAARRAAALLVLGFVLYGLTGSYQTWSELEALTWADLPGFFKRYPFEVLVHIALVSLWVLPVLARGPAARAAYAAGSIALFTALSWAFYYDWNHAQPRGIEGGPLAFLSWTVPFAAGTLARDVALAGGPVARRLLALGASLAAPGLLLSGLDLQPPVFELGQRTVSVAYQLLSTGVSLALFAGFWTVYERPDPPSGPLSSVFQSFGVNALAAYVLHELVEEPFKPLAPKDAPLEYGLALFSAYFGLCLLMTRWLNRRNLYLRL